MAYTKHIWQNGQSGGTPINADRLNEIEDGIEAANETADDALGTANSASAVASDAAGTADEANAKSDVAVDTATVAKQTADSATATAAAAASAASVADGKAVRAQASADDAQTAADAAQDTADTALTVAQQGGKGGGAPAKYAHFRIPKGQVPGGRDLATDWQLVTGETSAPDLATNLGNCQLRINAAGYYEFSLMVYSQGKSWTGGWMAVKDPGQTKMYASQDMPSGIGSWCISGAGYFQAGEVIFVQFHPAGSGDFLNCLLDFHLVQIGALTPVVTMAKHAEATYTYAQVHGNPWNAGLVMDPATTTDAEFVTWGTGNGLFTINETGIYSIDATVQSGAAIGGTLGIGDTSLTKWYGITDLGSAASSGIVPLSNVYLTAGTQLRYYYNCNSSANSASKTARVRITQIAAQPRSGAYDPRGLVAWARRSGATGTSSENVVGGGSAKPFLRLDCNLTPGRMYEVSTTAIRVGATPGLEYVQMNLGYTSGASVPATVYNRNIKADFRWQHPTDGMGGAPISFILPVPLDADPRHSFLVDVVAIGGSNLQAGLRPDAQHPLDIYVHDIGPIVADTSVHPGPGPGDNPAWNPAN